MRASLRLLAAGFGLWMAATVAFAAELPFDKAKFDDALAAGKPVVVDFQADWCPTCKAQKPIVQGLLKDPKYQGLTLFVANYDTEKDLKKRLAVSQQSTFVVFKAGKEVARSTGQTDKGALADLFSLAL
ncbi:MAG: redoxin domain-containing protein [Rhizobacter sp.]|nr:redoxin domain-containing protein [Rhizobacter sp.]